MTFICPFSSKKVNPKHCDNKRNSKPLIGMTDQFIQCRSCDIDIPEEIEDKYVIRQDSPITSIGPIEEDIPIPVVPRKGKVSFTSYPFKKMKIGNSFKVTFNKDKPGEGRRTANTLSCAASHFSKKHEPTWKFLTRQLKSEVRVWRVE